MKIAICISTLKRIDYLRTLLLSVNSQILTTNCELNIIVVDNDAARSSEKLIDEIDGQLKHKLKYDSESKHGIPFSRNKAVHMADRDTDYIIFVDDDEFADEHWLQNLIDAREKYQADLVSGVVYPKFIGSPPKWVVKGDFFVKRFYKSIKTGDERKYASTNNLLIRYDKLIELNGPFNEQMVFTGGSDIEMTMRLHGAGCKIVWTHEAILWEWVPKDRANIKWILQRALRVSATNWLFEKNKTIFNGVKMFCSGLGRIGFGLIFILPSLIFAPIAGLQYFVHIVRIIVRGFGVIAGIFGFRHEEYKKFYTHIEQ